MLGEEGSSTDKLPTYIPMIQNYLEQSRYQIQILLIYLSTYLLIYLSTYLVIYHLPSTIFHLPSKHLLSIIDFCDILPCYLTAIIIWEIFGGEASKAAATKDSVKTAFNAMRIIVLVGWAIYPLGYVFGYMAGSVDPSTLNGIYNIADFINKILFGLIIWNAAVKDSA